MSGEQSGDRTGHRRECEECGGPIPEDRPEDWDNECPNPHCPSRLRADGGRAEDDAAVFRCTNCGEEWVDPFTAIIGHSECVPEGEESARVVRVEGDGS